MAPKLAINVVSNFGFFFPIKYPIQTTKKQGTFKNIKTETLTSLPPGIPKSKPNQAKVKPVKKKKFKSQTGKKLKPFKYKTKNKGKKVVFR